MMISWSTELFNNSVRDYVIFFGLLALGAIVGKITSWIIRNVIKVFAAKTETKLDDVIVDVCDGPLVLAIFVGTLAFAQRILFFSATAGMIYSNIVRVMVTVTLSWAIIRFFDSVIEHYVAPYSEKSRSDLNELLLPILHSAVKIVVISFAIVMILSDFGFNVAGIVAGLGIGGLAFAFAAKDLIGNIFGGVSVITDKPFKIGDKIKFGDKQGIVKEIGIRTTILETPEGTTLYIPNAKFTDGIIENVSRKPVSRYKKKK